MKTNNESGHAKNVANFQTLISFCMGYGATYNPSNAALSIPSLKVVQSDAKLALDAVTTAKAIYDHTVNVRSEAFDPLTQLGTRILNALKACRTSEQKLEDARALVNKLRGTRASKKKTQKETVTSPETPEAINTHSVSYTSFVRKIETLESLVQLLQTEPKYLPNETDLSLSGLTNLLVELNNQSLQATEIRVTLSNARFRRDNLLYKDENSLCTLAVGVKNYVKSAFGVTSNQYKQISNIRFNRLPTAA